MCAFGFQFILAFQTCPIQARVSIDETSHIGPEIVQELSAVSEDQQFTNRHAEPVSTSTSTNELATVTHVSVLSTNLSVGVWRSCSLVSDRQKVYWTLGFVELFPLGVVVWRSLDKLESAWKLTFDAC